MSTPESQRGEAAVTERPLDQNDRDMIEAGWIAMLLSGAGDRSKQPLRNVADKLTELRQAAVEKHAQHIKLFLEELAEYLGLEGEVKPPEFLKAAEDIRQKMSDQAAQLAAQSAQLERYKTVLALVNQPGMTIEWMRHHANEALTAQHNPAP